MAYSDALRHPGPRLVNPNHLLYGVVGVGAYRFTAGIVRDPDPMRVLQHMGAVTALACLALFYALLASLGLEPRASTAFTLCLAFTAGFWLQAISPETFLLSMTLEVLVFRLAVHYLDAPVMQRCILLGVGCGLAVLGTEVDVLLAIPAAWVLWKRAAPRRLQHLAIAGTSAMLTAGGGFTLAAIYVGVEPPGLIPWLLGRATESGFFGFSPVNLARDFKNLLLNLYPRLSPVVEVLGGNLSWQHLAFTALAIVSTGILVFLVVGGARGLPSLGQRDRSLVILMGGYLAALTAFFTVWTNSLSEFWANHWIPLWGMLAVATKPTLQEKHGVGRLLWILAASLGFLNLLFLAVPLRFSEEGSLTAKLRQRIAPADLVLVSWDEAIPPSPTGLRDRTYGEPVRRSTYAVNLETYLNRPVEHIGCWHITGHARCFESIGGESLFEAIRETTRAGNRAWWLRMSAQDPQAGLSSPDLFHRLAAEFAVKEADRSDRGPVFSDSTLCTLSPGGAVPRHGREVHPGPVP